MADLDDLRAHSPPRSPELVRRYRRRIAPVWGFVLYGVLWFCVACGTATAGLLAMVLVVGEHPGPLGRALVFAGWIGGFVGAWVLFGMWVRRRLRPAVVLVRDGQLMEARVETVHHLSMRGAPFTRARLSLVDGGRRWSLGLSVGGHPAELHEGATIPVLFAPDLPHCGTFPHGGKMVPASVSSSS